MPDPDHDDRPDRAKADDFVGHLQRVHANMNAVDADFIGRVRVAIQAGSQADAKQLLADYRSLIAADIAALPGAPRLSGCFAKAAAPNANYESVIATMLSDRRDKAEAVAAITDRPLTLPDFGGLATDIAGGPNDSGSILAAAQAGVAGCRDAPAVPTLQRSRPSGAAQQPLSGQSSERMSVQIISPPAPPPASAPQPQKPPPKKPSLFQRMFGGGS